MKKSYTVFSRIRTVGEICRRSSNARSFFCLTGAALALASTSCIASSRMGSAVITQVDGLPCFTVPMNSETRDGVPFTSVTVTKLNAPGATTLPEKVWISRVQPRGNTILWKPQQCVRYGVSPSLAEQEVLIPLQPHQIYTVMFKAVPEGTNLRGYHAEFCMIPDASKKLRVQVVPWDEKASKWRYDLCAPGAK